MPKGRKVVNDKGVYDEACGLLDDLDLMAAAVNATLWSGMKSQAYNEKKPAATDQWLCNIATTAVIRNGNDYVFAFNDHRLDRKLEKDFQAVGSKGFKAPSQQDLPVRMKVTGTTPFQGTPDDAAKHAMTRSMDPAAMKKRADVKTTVLTQDNDKKWVTRTFEPRDRTDVLFDPENALVSLVDDLLINDLGAGPATRILVLRPENVAMEHAEMRLVAYCLKHSWRPTYIGVSKPCCERCADQLEAKGFQYGRWCQVGVPAERFKTPDQITATTEETWRHPD